MLAQPLAFSLYESDSPFLSTGTSEPGATPAPVPAPPARAHLTQQWLAFLCAMDGRAARLAALQGEPYTPLTTAERAAAAHLVAASGMAPPAPGAVW